MKNLKIRIVTAYANLAGSTRLSASVILFRIILFFPSVLYSAVISLRNFFYDAGVFKIYNADVPVISIGNLTWGGNYKTSMVIYLAERLKRNSAVLIRGYGQDEYEMLKEKSEKNSFCIYAGKKRSELLLQLNGDIKLIFLDDGFQHRRIHRDIDIVMINSKQLPGQFVIPAGNLREQLSGLKRADIVIFTNTECVSDKLRMFVERYNRKCSIFAAQYKPHKLPDYIGKSSAAMFCAIAFPEGFESTLEEMNIKPKIKFIYPDHHVLTEQQFRDIEKQCSDAGVSCLLITHKDKARFKFKTFLNIHVVDVDILIDNEITLLNEIERCI